MVEKTTQTSTEKDDAMTEKQGPNTRFPSYMGFSVELQGDSHPVCRPLNTLGKSDDDAGLPLGSQSALRKTSFGVDANRLAQRMLAEL